MKYDIYNLTHYDLDGVVCNIILSLLFKNIKTYCCGYGKLDDKIDTIIRDYKFDKPKALLITDFCLTVEHLKKLIKRGIKIIYIDHHIDSLPYKKTKKFKHYIDKNKSGALLTFEYFEKRLSKKYKEGVVEKVKTLVKLANDYDLWKLEDKRSYYINQLFWDYNFWRFRQRFRYGFKNFFSEEINKVKKYIKELKKYAYSTERFVFPNDKKDAILIVDPENKLANDATLIFKKFNFYFILRTSASDVSIRVRNVPEDLNVSEIMSEKFEDLDHIFKKEDYGGHAKAAGFSTKNIKKDETFNQIINLLYEALASKKGELEEK